jgi:hypothetical protein
MSSVIGIRFMVRGAKLCLLFFGYKNSRSAEESWLELYYFLSCHPMRGSSPLTAPMQLRYEVFLKTQLGRKCASVINFELEFIS